MGIKLRPREAECRLAVVDFPISFRMESHLKKAVFGIMAFAAAGADQIAAPGGALAIVVLGDGEGGAAAAGDEEHAEVCWRFYHCGFGGALHLASSYLGSTTRRLTPML